MKPATGYHFIMPAAEVLWLIVGAPEELEFLPGSEYQMDLTLIYPEDPTQLPPEFAGKPWPPEPR